ncbi:glyoxylate/hydroxypyruvate reductase A [Mesonia sp. HuA40]|uniref:2-hydroxyacid dehydrogenase n=1 Tax=Mesonia sp. HuA40 TaxID=2602761 RepID=UPI0011C8DA66|nr:glyoxylate/hydroxypyruvate reductase A [Mesonia sp. HuA40]TXK73881.1 glyoxylate/hydroxypyruvate reductase A [Mesonia sp. HuA40]
MNNKIVVIAPGRNLDQWVQALKDENKNLTIEIYPNDTQREKTEFILTWQPPAGVFDQYPNLKVIASMGAGVHHIFAQNTIKEHIQVTKIEHPRLATDLSQFVLSICLMHIRDLYAYFKLQQKKKWKPIAYKRPKDTVVGILGFGKIGQSVGELLVKNNFQVLGYSSTAKTHENITTYHSEQQLPQFLQSCDILVCLLPLTSKTRGILNSTLFNQLKPGCYLINVGRGAHLKENDLLEALQNGQLCGASIDVFSEEPLPQNHAFWENEHIQITPHMASATDPKVVSQQIVSNLERLHQGKAMKNRIDQNREY